MPLYTHERRRTVALPIGGIGTGCFSIDGYGGLCDWEIFHRPNKGCLLPNTFFAIRAQAAGSDAVSRVLQTLPEGSLIGDILGTNFYGHGFGVRRESGLGFPLMQGNTFRGEYPFAWIDFQDDRLPVQVSMMAYNPFIPHDADGSGVPAGIFEFTLTNTSHQPVEVSLAASLFNAVGYRGHSTFTYIEHGEFKGTGHGNINRYSHDAGLHAIHMSSEVYTPDVMHGGTMALATPWGDVSHQTAWLRGAWFDTLQCFWDEFLAHGRLTDRTYDAPSDPNTSDTGSLALHAALQPGETVRLPVYMCWHFPNFIKYWETSYQAALNPHTWRVPYAARFADALDVARCLAADEPRLRDETTRFHDALFASTLPDAVLDAASSQLATLKSNTVTLLHDGSFYGWEGTHSTHGSCEGSCTHVWNYAISHAALFPALERSMRANAYRHALWDDGRMSFRLTLPLGAPPADFHPAADGQMGNVMQVYRDWKWSGDTGWLRDLWPLVRRSLEYAWKYWDYNADGVMEGLQHNTYDIEFYGPNSFVESWYLGALAAAAEMADALDEPEHAAHYRALAAQGKAWTDAHLFNGDYYEQQLDLEAIRHSPVSTDKSLGGQREGTPKYQYGAGCLSDQVIGAWMARICGLGDILDPAHVARTLDSIYEHNFRASLREHSNAQRIYAVGDEGGLLLCTWPRGGRPDLPFVYSDEVWTGIEYQVAAHLIYAGRAQAGLDIVQAARERYTGARRNPFSELECGSHYARALASWGVLLALSGFDADLTHGRLSFAPALDARPFRCFWSTGTGWGLYSEEAANASLHCDYGEQVIREWRTSARVSTLMFHGQPVSAQVTPDGGGTRFTLDAPLHVRTGEALEAI
jgi:non-lysosomal glucosylceramidase